MAKSKKKPIRKGGKTPPIPDLEKEEKVKTETKELKDAGQTKDRNDN